MTANELLTARRIYTSRRADRHDGFPADHYLVPAAYAQIVRRHYRSLMRRGVPQRIARHTITSMLSVGVTSTWRPSERRG